MKRMEVTEKTIGENKFYLTPFPAFAAVNISGELAATLTPILGGLASGRSGATLERLMRKLLTESGNISVEGPITEGEVMVLSKDLADEVFCGDVQDMFILAFEVIRLNFNGFFKKIGALFGSQEQDQKETPTTGDGEN